jgi:hypothetical protein
MVTLPDRLRRRFFAPSDGKNGFSQGSIDMPGPKRTPKVIRLMSGSYRSDRPDSPPPPEPDPDALAAPPCVVHATAARKLGICNQQRNTWLLRMIDRSMLTAANQVGFFQSGLLGIRVERLINWAPRRAAAATAAYIDGVFIKGANDGWILRIRRFDFQFTEGIHGCAHRALVEDDSALSVRLAAFEDQGRKLSVQQMIELDCTQFPDLRKPRD